MDKQEARLKSAFMKELRRQLPSFIVLQHVTPGAPDRAIVGNGKTSFWECKHGTPSFVSFGHQELFCMRLAQEAYCRYLVWQEDATGKKQTLIVLPRVIHERHGWMLQAETSCDGFNHVWAVNQVRRI